MNNFEYFPCKETPDNCTFSLINFQKGDIFYNHSKDTNNIVFCRQGCLRLNSIMFQEQILYAGEILFLPRLIDCQGESKDDTQLIIHTFNNTVCRPELCILSYLYSHHKNKSDPAINYYCKIVATSAIITFIESIYHYLIDNIGDQLLWNLKHKELIRLFSRYYKPKELQSFFHPMTDEAVPFKNLVLTHYQKAQTVIQLAELCGYGLETFRRKFNTEFGIPVYKWLIHKKAELIKYRLSFFHLPFKDIIEEFHFTSPQQFTRFCKTYLGDTPSNLRNTMKKQYIDTNNR